jgi:hypothetical protein
LVTSKLIIGYDNDCDSLVDCKEFKIAIDEILEKIRNKIHNA